MLLDELWLWLELDDEEGIDGELLLELWLLDWQANKLKLTPPSRISLGNMLNVCFIRVPALDSHYKIFLEIRAVYVHVCRFWPQFIRISTSFGRYFVAAHGSRHASV